jgi:threonine dehydratase
VSDWAALITGARHRIKGLVVETPLVAWGDSLWLKCENAQVTGSFKLRGALNKILRLTSHELATGVVAASAGNHGQGVAYAARLVGARATIVVPDDAVQRKVVAIRALGAEVIEVPGGYGAAEIAGRRMAVERGAVWVSPYNDPDIIAGQGTIGLELLEQLDEAADVEVFVPVSGGGLVSGIGLALRSDERRFAVYGAQAEHAPYMHAYVHGKDPGRVVEKPTLADGLSGPIEAGSLTLELARDVMREVWLVSEAEILEALRYAWLEQRLGMEPSSAVALAAARRHGRGAPAIKVVIVSGGNVAPETLRGLES